MFNGGVVAIAGVPFTEADVRAAADGRSFERGRASVGAVTALEAGNGVISAIVRGTEEYRVELTGAGGRLGGWCDCPRGREGSFCKHCVAVGLAVLRNAPFVPAPRAAGRDRDVAVGGLHSWLASLSREELLGLAREHAAEDDDWRSLLGLRAAVASGDADGVAARIGALLSPGGFARHGYLEPGEAWRYARRVREAARAVAGLTGRGHAARAAELGERALELAAAACHGAGDQAGALGAACDELVGAHQRACAAAPPDPAALAGFLARRMLSGDSLPRVTPEGYLAALGRPGLARLRQTLAGAWQASRARWPAGEALERVLRAAGDVDALVGVITSGADERGQAHLRAAAELDQAARPAEALALAERGLQEASDPCDELIDYLSRRYEAAGRDCDALAVRRAAFLARRDLPAYQRLRRAARRAGDWPAAREWALGLLREGAGGAPGRVPAAAARRTAGPVLIEALLDDGDLERAWESAGGVATQEQWLRLADLVAPEHPERALGVYLRQIASLRRETGERAYLRLARLLESARQCHQRLGSEAEFDAYLRALRSWARRRRALMAILDARGLRPAAATTPSA